VQGYRRPDGSVGIRNHIIVIYTSGCAQVVSEKIAALFPGIQVVGWSGCHADAFILEKLLAVGKHPNTCAVLVVSLGCESISAEDVIQGISTSGKPVESVVIQEAGGTLKAVEQGARVVEGMIEDSCQVERVGLGPADLVLGVECGGSDVTSGLAANPAVGTAVDLLIDAGGTVVFTETAELLGCEELLSARASSEKVAGEIKDAIERARREFERRGFLFSIARGNMVGGLTTREEKSIGALRKTGFSPVKGVLKLFQRPPTKGLYLLDQFAWSGLDKTPYISGEVITDPKDMVKLTACGVHLIVFTTGRGSVAGCVVSPVLKVCGNPTTYLKMRDNMDINAAPIISGSKTCQEIGMDIYEEILKVASGKRTKAEVLGHSEY